MIFPGGSGVSYLYGGLVSSCRSLRRLQSPGWSSMVYCRSHHLPSTSSPFVADSFVFKLILLLILWFFLFQSAKLFPGDLPQFFTAVNRHIFPHHFPSDSPETAGIRHLCHLLFGRWAGRGTLGRRSLALRGIVAGWGLFVDKISVAQKKWRNSIGFMVEITNYT